MSEVETKDFHENTFEPIESQEPTPALEPEVPAAEPTEEELLSQGVDNPKSYKHFQRIADEKHRLAEQRLGETVQERQLREQAEQRAAEYEQKVREYEQRLQQFEQKPEPELTIPQEPQRPYDYNPADAYDPNSSTFKYEQDYKAYLKGMVEYQNKQIQQVSTTLQEQKQKEQLSQQQQAIKAKWIGDFIKAGADPDEATKVYNFMNQSGTGSPENLLKFHRFLQGNSQASVKNKEKFPATATPPGVETGGENVPLKSPDDLFNESITPTTRKWI